MLTNCVLSMQVNHISSLKANARSRACLSLRYFKSHTHPDPHMCCIRESISNAHKSACRLQACDICT